MCIPRRPLASRHARRPPRGRRVDGAWLRASDESSERAQRRKGRFWIQKKPGVQRRQASRFLAHYLTWRQEAANHHEFRLSDQSMPVGARRQAPVAKTFARTARQMCADRCCPARSSAGVTFGYGHEVVSSVPEAVFFRAPNRFFGGYQRLAGDLGGTYISPIVVVDPPPIRRPIRTTRSRGDLTVTTRPGVVAFHRSRFSRLASPCSGGGAPCGAADGANFNREAHT
jgi:hypothetical protein